MGVNKFQTSLMSINIGTFETAEQAAAARDYIGMSNDPNYKRQLDKNTYEKQLTDDQKRQINETFLTNLAKRRQKQASKTKKLEK